MFKILSKIFSPSKLTNSIVSGIDKVIYTKEESVDNHKELLKLYEPYKLAQRLLALMITGIYLLIHVFTAITHFVLVVQKKATGHIIELYEYNQDILGNLMLFIIGFYFGGGAIEGVVRKFKTKKHGS